MGTSLTRGLLGPFLLIWTLPPPFPMFTQMDSQGSGPTWSQRIATSPWSATRVWSPIGPVPVLNSLDTKLYPIQQHLHGTLPVKAWMLEQSKGRGHLWCWEREGSFSSQISSWWMTQTCPIFSPPLISVAANIQYVLHDEPSHKNAHKQCFSGSGSNGTRDRPQLSTLGFMNLHWQAGWRGIISTTQLSSDNLFCWSNLVLLFEFQTILLVRPWVFVFQFRTHLKIAASNLLASN